MNGRKCTESWESIRCRCSTESGLPWNRPDLPPSSAGGSFTDGAKGNLRRHFELDLGARGWTAEHTELRADLLGALAHSYEAPVPVAAGLQNALADARAVIS